MSTYTDNNNAIDFNLIAGIEGPQGYTGSKGLQGEQGINGDPGIQGAADYISTDIAYSGGGGNSSDVSISQNPPTPYKSIREGGIRLVGSCIFDRQEELRNTGSTEVKVLINATTRTLESTEIGLVLNGNIVDSNGETRIATAEVTVPGSGYISDSIIVPLTLTSNTLLNEIDVLSLWAYIRPTQEEMEQTLASLTDGGYSMAQIANYKYLIYSRPYYITPAALWEAMSKEYNTTTSPTPLQAYNWSTELIADAEQNMAQGVALIDYEIEQKGILKVFYLQIEE